MTTVPMHIRVPACTRDDINRAMRRLSAKEDKRINQGEVVARAIALWIKSEEGK